MTDFLRKYAPSFCWVTSADLFRMLAAYFPGCPLCIASFRVVLNGAVREGWMETKRNTLGGNIKLLYRRVS